MVLLGIRQEALGEQVDEDRLQPTLDRQVEDALLDSADSQETAGVETGNWSYSLPSPGVRYYAFHEPCKPKANRSSALPKAAPRYGVGGGLRGRKEPRECIC